MTNITQGRFQVYYDKIRREVEQITNDNNYLNQSKGFAHWYLQNFLEIDETTIGEIIIDGDGDNGIDAIIIKDGSMFLYQFKFPDKVTNIGKQQNETTVLKLINGYIKLTSNRTPTKSNLNFNAFRERVKTESIFKYSFYFVGFSSDLSENAKDALEAKIEEIKMTTGNAFEYFVEDKKKICDKYDRKQLKHNIQLSLKYGQLVQSYNTESNVSSWSGFAKATDILDSCKDYMDVIFDENIRNYEGDNSVNLGIINTASNQEQSANFYFFHNGIVFICDKCNVSTGNQIAMLESTAIVNGCQSVVSLKKASDAGKLRDDVFLPIRVIVTNDIDLRAQITEYLNSQTKIKDSYFLANNLFIRELQNQMKEKGYFLERLTNEYSYKKSLNKIDEYQKDRIIPLEKAIQIYVSYTSNKFASAAKRSLSEIFDKNVINDLIKDINADKLINSIDKYNHISKIITLYRKCRRVDRNDSFLNQINIEPKNQVEYDNLMNNYQFMNTSDLLLTNAFANIKDESLDLESKITLAIETCKSVIDKNSKLSPSSATKNTTVFEEVQLNLSSR